MVVLMTLLLFLILLLFAFTAGIDRGRKEIVREAYESVKPVKLENEKLRELCKDIWNDALHFDGFWDYVHDDGTIYREDELPHYQERMLECGIEVK